MILSKYGKGVPKYRVRRDLDSRACFKIDWRYGTSSVHLYEDIGAET